MSCITWILEAGEPASIFAVPKFGPNFSYLSSFGSPFQDRYTVFFLQSLLITILAHFLVLIWFDKNFLFNLEFQRKPSVSVTHCASFGDGVPKKTQFSSLVLTKWTYPVDPGMSIYHFHICYFLVFSHRINDRNLYLARNRKWPGCNSSSSLLSKEHRSKP